MPKTTAAPAAAAHPHQALIERLNWPAPDWAGPDDDIVMPVWALELMAEAARALAASTPTPSPQEDAL